MKSVEEKFERALLASRILLAPLYGVLALLLIALSAKGVQSLYHLVSNFMQLGESDFVLAALELVDLALVGNLIVMVTLSSYETFVSKFDTAEHVERPSWLGRYDPGTIKVKVAASIVAISAIHLLKEFINVGEEGSSRLLVLTAVHLAFVASALVLAFVDKIAFASHRDPHGK